MQCVQLWVLLLGPYAFAVARYRSLVSLVTCCVILWFTSVNRKKSTAAACEHLPGTLPSGAKKVSCAALHASRVCYVILWFAFAFSLFIRDVQRHCRG